MRATKPIGLVLEKLYACGTRVDADAKEDLLRCVGDAFASHISALHVDDNRHRATLFNSFGGMPAAQANENLARSGGRNLWFERGGPKLLNDGIADDRGLLLDAELIASSFYREYLRPMDVRHGLGVCLHSDTEGRMAAISVNRDARRGPFRAQEYALGHQLLPHLRNVYNLQQRLSWLEAQLASFRAALDRLAFGAILLDRNGSIVFANTEAQKLCTEKLGIVDRERHLHATWLADMDGLRQLVARACEGLLMPKPDSICLHDDTGNAVATATISPVAGITTLAWSESNVAAVLFVHRLLRAQAKNADRLCSIFGLTPAEAQLADQLIAGATLAQASERLGKRITTLRTQLRALFDKTGTRRQSELLRVLDHP